MKRGQMMVDLCTAGTSGRSYSIVKIFQLGKFVIVPYDQVRSTHIKELNITKYNEKDYWCVIFKTGDINDMETLLTTLNTFNRIDNDFKYLGNLQTSTQTVAVTLIESGTQTEDCPVKIPSHNIHTGESLMVADAENICGIYNVLGSGEVVSLTAAQDTGVPADVSELQVTYSNTIAKSGDISVGTSKICPETHSTDDLAAASSSQLYAHADTMANQDSSTGTFNVNPDSIKKKKHFCLFCKKLKSNISRHFITVHRNEEKVNKFYSLPTKSNERTRLEAELRRTGDAEYNEMLRKEGKPAVTIRKGVSVKQVLHCPNCKLLYNKATLNRHYRICSNTRAPKNLINIATGLSHVEELTKDYCSEFTQYVLPGMSQDNVSKSIMKDEVILEYGNSLSLRHAGDIKNKKNFVRAQMRSVAKLRLLSSELDNSINKIKDLFHPNKWNIFIEAVRLLGNISADVGDSSPYNIIHVGLSILNIAKDFKAVQPIDEEGKKIREEIQAWIELYNRKFQSTVGKHALKVAAKKKWKKSGYLPVAEDVIKLTTFLKKEIEESISNLTARFPLDDYERLNKATMLQLLIFNRKRIGEVQFLKLEDFYRKEKISEDSDAFKNLYETEKFFAKRFYHVNIKGKWHRPVPVLISEELSRAIDMIIKMREFAGVDASNPNLFGRGQTDHYNASVCIKEAAFECNAKHPGNLTGTKLRKHVATVAQALSLTENDLRILSGFLGHTVQTHLEHYRQPSNVLHTARLSRLLLALDSGDLAKFKGKTIDDINLDIEISEQQEETLLSEDIDEPPKVISTRSSKEKLTLKTSDLKQSFKKNYIVLLNPQRHFLQKNIAIFFHQLKHHR